MKNYRHCYLFAVIWEEGRKVWERSLQSVYWRGLVCASGCRKTSRTP